ncbi:hypothetical protein AJ79_08932 [Helicocarpus griseus UAMH5409]|uniref:Aminotransferase class I/classII large domain-containing protein n=1 Tax=Helicocarpus griseus UAMH5409 TaxID=1447875 RepID=A0A2B7WFS0_9EURO|nr:hypothetical protein AJ79_08932 [Helicocarpus griseus UAMH5409]
MGANKYAIGSLIPMLSSSCRLRDQQDGKHPEPKQEKDKTPQSYSISPPLDLSHHFSVSARNRVASNVKKFYKYFAIPGIHNLAGGLPHSSYFPYDTLEATVALPNRFDQNPPKKASNKNNNDQTNDTSPATHLTVPRESASTDPLTRIDLTTALQYGTAEGYPPLLSFVRQFVRENLHPNVPYTDGPEVVLTCGATDGFSKTIEALTNVWDEERDWVRNREGILCEEFVYMNAIQTVRPRGLNVIAVGMDNEGMRIEGQGGLKDVLENWDFSRGRRPHLMYTVTIGQNPTGSVLPVPRRREIYALCQKYDIIIVEDDPYWHLQYPSARQQLQSHFRGGQPDLQNGKCNYNVHGKPSGYPFLDSLVPSYLSIDTDGRVLRLDTFSKSIAPGCRLGWLTAQPKIVERIVFITETSTQQPSGFVQAMVASLIMGSDQDAHSQGQVMTAGDDGDRRPWKTDGWVRWLEGLRAGYEKRMQVMCTILEEGREVIGHSKNALSPSISSSSSDGEENEDDDDEDDDWHLLTKTPLYTFQFPRGGMFVWVRMCFETHPLWSREGVSAEQLSIALWKHLTRKPFLCLVAPGQMFDPTRGGNGEACRFFRLCFAPMAEGDVEAAAKGFVEGCKDFWRRGSLEEDEGGEEEL